MIFLMTFLLLGASTLRAMEKLYNAREIPQQCSIVDALLKELEQNTDHLSLLNLSDDEIRKCVEKTELKTFFKLGLLDAVIQHAATAPEMKLFAYELPYAASHFVSNELPICLYRTNNSIELYHLDTLKSTGKLSFPSDYSVVFSPNAVTFCIWNARRCMIFETKSSFTYDHLEPANDMSEKSEKSEVTAVAELVPDAPIRAVRYTNESSISVSHLGKDSCDALFEHYSTPGQVQKNLRPKNGTSSAVASVDSHYIARIIGGNRVKIVSEVCSKGTVRTWQSPVSLADVVWPSYETGICMSTKKGSSVVVLITRVAYFLSRYKKITAAYATTSFLSDPKS